MASSLIGQLRILLGLETASFESSSKKAKTELYGIRDAGEAVKHTLETLGITLGAAALFEYAKGSLEFAAALETTANRIGVTVEQLQVMRQAARENGVASDVMEQALAKLNLTLGKAQGGNAAALKAFAQIKIGPEQLASLHQGGDVLRAVEEGLHNVGDKAEQAAAAWGLVGKGAAAALPILAMGKDAYDAMYDSAVKSGLITSEEAGRAHEAQDAIENLAIALKTKLAEALTENTDDVKDLVAELTNLVSMIPKVNKALDDQATYFQKDWIIIQRMSAQYMLATGQITLGQYQAIDAAAGREFNHQDYKHQRLGAQANGQNPVAEGGPNSSGAWADMRAEFPVSRTPPPPPNTLDLSSHHHARKHDDSAQRATDAENKTYAAEKAQLDGQKQLLEAQQSLITDYVERAQVARELADGEADAQELAVKHQLAVAELDPKLTAAKKAELEVAAERQLSLINQLHFLKIEEINAQTELQRQQEQVAVEDATYSAKASILQSQEKIAQTAAERRKIELELLDIAYQQKKNDLAHIQSDTYTWTDQNGQVHTEFSHSLSDRQKAGLDQQALDASHPLERQAVLQNTRGPLDQLAAGIPDTAAKMNEALETVAAQGLSQVDDGLAQASASWIKMGGVAGDVLRQIYSGLMKILIMKYLEKPLLNAFGFGSASGGGFGDGVDTSIEGAFGLPHFADGGSMVIGGMAGVDQNTLSLNGSPIARVGMGETLSITPANDAGGSGGPSYLFDLRGAVMTDDLLAQMNALAEQASVRGAAGGALLGRMQSVQAAGRRLGR